jgi:SNF2 family DNA or RNA helicase
MQIIQDKALLFTTTNPLPITENILRSKAVGNDVIVKWRQEEVEALTSLGVYNAPSPILRDYEWTGKLTPFDHQRTTSAFLAANRKAFCFNEAGTGKTASVIWAADYLMKRGLVRRVLVICPLSIMRAAWQQDLFKFAMHRSCNIAYGLPKRRQRVIASDTEFVIINFDGVRVVEKEIATGGFDLIVVDEASAYKSAQTERWKVLNRIVRNTNPRLWMMTGTPAAQSPVDAYGLAKMLDAPGCPKAFSLFRDRVMHQVTKFKWAPKPNAMQVVHEVLQPAIRFEKRECLDLPPVTFVEREAPLTPQQLKYYRILKKDMTFASGGVEINAVNAAVQLGKLLQVSCGAVYADDGSVMEFDVSNRVNAVLEVIHETSNKVLLFVPFTSAIEMLAAKLAKEGVSCDVINGDVSVNRRGDIVQRFQTHSDPKVLIIQPQAASHGLTLTAADTVIWYAPVTSVETYLQANARIDRPGQKNAMTIVHIKGSPVEDKLYTMLRENIGNHQKLIGLYHDILDTV